MSSGYNSETLSFPVAMRQYPMAWIPRMSPLYITLELPSILDAVCSEAISYGACPGFERLPLKHRRLAQYKCSLRTIYVNSTQCTLILR